MVTLGQFSGESRGGDLLDPTLTEPGAGATVASLIRRPDPSNRRPWMPKFQIETSAVATNGIARTWFPGS